MSALKLKLRPFSHSLEKVYHTGAIFQLYKQHPPPLPTRRQPLLTLDDINLETTKGRLYNCHRHNIPIPPNTSSLPVTLVSPLSVGIRECPTQVWKVSSGLDRNESHSDPTLIARFYDPFYYEDPDGLIDPFIAIDRSTATEHETYRRLQPLQGDLLPNFHGLFLCGIPTQSRNVYVVLLDYIHGVDLASLDTRALCTDHKNAIVDKVFEVLCRLEALGVKHNDVAPRNFILCPSMTAGAPSPGAEYCMTTTCPLRSTLNIDVQTIRLAVIDLEDVILDDPELPFDPEEQERLERDRIYMRNWFWVD